MSQSVMVPVPEVAEASLAPLAPCRVLRHIGADPETYEGETLWNCSVVEFDGRRFVVSTRAILTMVVVAACNAACKFCSNEITFTPAGPYLRYDERLARVKAFALGAGVTKVAYTGGEPTLQPQRLYDLVSQMSPGFERSRLHTNGSGLFKEIELAGPGQRTSPLLPALISSGLTGVSLSVAHYDTKANRELMRFGRAWDVLPPSTLEEIATYRSPDFTPRLSCVMTSDGVCTVDGILEYITWGRAMGYRHFIFRSCSEIPEEYQKPTAFSEFNNVNFIPIEPISQALREMPFLEHIYSQRKSDSKVDVFRWSDVTFDVDESSEEPDPDRKIRRLNVMTNGITHTSWIDPLSVLFEEDRAKAEDARRREFKVSQ